MTVSLYETSIGTFRLMLGSLAKNLSKAEAHAHAQGFDPSNLLAARLAPDMFNLTRQVQIACDLAKAAGARLAGIEPPRHEDTETDIAGLLARIDRVLGWLETLDREAIESAAEREIRFTVQNHELKFQGQRYLVTWALPNFYFHVTMAYALLRHQGVSLGKRDYLGITG